MHPRPVIHIPLNRSEKFLETCCALLLVAIWIVAAWGYHIMPETIPMHYNLQNKANGYGSKATVFILPSITVLLYALLTFVARFPHYFNYLKPVTPENAREQYTTATLMIRWLKTVILLVFAIETTDMVLTATGRAGMNYFFALPPLAVLIVPYIFITRSVSRPGKKA